MPRNDAGLAGQCASAQVRPAPVSTTSGTDSTAALSITCARQRGQRRDLVLRRLEQQFVVHLQQQPRLQPGFRAAPSAAAPSRA